MIRIFLTSKYISGVPLAKGYHNPLLTKERFLHIPDSDQVWYKTGDLCRLLDSGDMQYLGRIDTQVKVRGYRIDLGELESTSSMFAGVSQAIALNNPKELVKSEVSLFLVTETTFDASKFREFLKNKLPPFMIPKALVFGTPGDVVLTPSGKVDRVKMAEKLLQSEEPIEKSEAPVNLITSTWRQYLTFDMSAKSVNFFDIGGDSLAAMNIVMKLNQLGTSMMECD